MPGDIPEAPVPTKDRQGGALQPAPAPKAMQGGSLAQKVLGDPAVRAALARDGIKSPVRLEDPPDEYPPEEPVEPVAAEDLPLSALLPPLTNGPEIIPQIIPEEDLGALEIPLERLAPSQPTEPWIASHEDGRYSMYPARIETSVTVCVPTIRDFTPQVFLGFMMLFRKYELGLELQADTLLIRARNLLANRFLASHAKWALWLDSDMLLPYGDASWFAEKSRLNRLSSQQKGFDVVERLLSHNYPFVGAVYAARTAQSQLVIQPDIDPRYANDRTLAESIRNGQTRGLVGVDWVGFGCALIHRKVFEAVRDRTPRDRSREVDFFSTEGQKGEDVSFCERAAAAGFKPKLDSELVIGHVGRHCFGPQHTQPWRPR